MFDIGGTELLLMAVVALVIIGPKDLPRVLRVIGQYTGKARTMTRHLRSGFDEMLRQAELEEMEKKWADYNRQVMAQTPAIADAAPTPAAQHPAAPDPTPAEAPAETASAETVVGEIAARETAAGETRAGGPCLRATGRRRSGASGRDAACRNAYCQNAAGRRISGRDVCC